MPMYPVGAIVESQLLIDLQGSECMVTNFFQVTNTPPLPTTLRDEIRDGYWQILRGMCSNRVFAYAWKSRVVDSAPTTEFVTEVFDARTGGVISNLSYEGQCTVIVVDHEASPGFKVGRMYPPGSGLGYVNGTYDANGIARIDTVCNGLRARYAMGGTLPWLMMLKRTRVGNDVFYNRVTGFRFRRYVGSQRRRRPGFGG
jgi:hypothetical protein